MEQQESQLDKLKLRFFRVTTEFGDEPLTEKDKLFIQAVCRQHPTIKFDDQFCYQFQNTNYVFFVGSIALYTLLGYCAHSLYKRIINQRFEKETASNLAFIKLNEARIHYQNNRNVIFEQIKRSHKRIKIPCLLVSVIVGAYHGYHTVRFNVKLQAAKYITDDMTNQVGQ